MHASEIRRARPWLAALLSFLLAGWGQLYVWRPAATLAALLVAYGAIAAALTALRYLPGPLSLAITVVVIVGTPVSLAMHAWRLARRSPAARRPRRAMLALALFAFLAFGIVLNDAVRGLIVRDFLRAFRIPSDSMEPTILSGDYLIIAARHGQLLRHDEPATYLWEGKTFLKRVVALGGDTIEMRHGRLYRDSRLVPELYARTDTTWTGRSSDFDWQRSALITTRDSASYHASIDDWGPLVVPSGQVFVLGDNRHNSLDSRYTGFVAADSVLGVPVSVYFSRDPESGAIRWRRIGHRFE